MNKINAMQTGGFPMETDTLDFLQGAYDIFNKLGYIAGNNIILIGCEAVGDYINPGYLFIGGEVVKFEGGNKSGYLRITETTESREFEDGNTKIIYRYRTAVFGSSGVAWSLFKRFRGLAQITQEVDELKAKAVPVGSIVMWAGSVNSIPTGWALCDGTNGTPNLKGRFVVGYNPDDADYDTIGKNGGWKKVQLTEAQLPNHNHEVSVRINDPGHRHKFSDDINTGSSLRQNNDIQRVTTSPDNERISGSGDGRGCIWRTSKETTGITATVTEVQKGSNEVHENRPPYYTLAFIQLKGI